MENIEQYKYPKIAIGFFGITRSTTITLPSIQENIILPARSLGQVKLFAHLYQQTRINNPRSGENDALDPEEYRLLGCDEVTLEAPTVCLKELRYNWILSHGDAFHDEGKSLANLIHQLHSLQVLGQMIDRWEPDVIVLARPDLQYHDSIGHLIAHHLKANPNELTIPDWQWYGGVNDRLAICGPDASKVYTRRIFLIEKYLQKTGGPLPAERFLWFSLCNAGILPKAAHVRASRVRANGNKVDENFSPVSISKRFRRTIEYYASLAKNKISGNVH